MGACVSTPTHIYLSVCVLEYVHACVCVCGCVGVRVCSNVRVVKCSYFFRGKKRYIKTSHLGILERLFEKQFKVPEAAAAKVMGKVKKAAKKYSSASLKKTSLKF